MTWVLIIGLLIHAIALPIVARRLWFLFRLARHGQPAPDRIASVKNRFGRAAKTEAVEVFGQRRLLQWTVPGLAHFFTFWAFVILGTVYVEAYGVMLSRNPKWAIPVVGHWWILGFIQDFIALCVLASITTFLIIRLKNAPSKLGRKSRFKGSNEFGAYLVLFFIFMVVATMFVFRGASAALGNFDNSGAFVSNAIGRMLDGLSHGTLEIIEGIGLLGHLGVMLVFLIEVVHSKHLHLLVAPINVIFKRHPIALGAAKPLMSDGKPVTLDDIEEMDEDVTLGVGSIEDFSWKGILDMESCVECGRCQSQCPAWNTEKPLSPKLMMMALRDHAYKSGDYLLLDESGRTSYEGPAKAESERPLVGATEGDPWAPTGGGIIDPDVLWSCVTCGACVQQCPVDIEHVDHILDMRRYQVLVESNFPAELNQLFKGMEAKGNPWNMSATARMDWAKGLDFEVPVVGEDLESLDSVDWLFWVGCAGAYEDRAIKTTRAVAELLNMAGVSFGVLGNGETCTGDSARRSGNEFLFQGLAQQNIETFKEYKVKKVVSTCAHCFNTLKNEYKQLGLELEVIHHTQLLNRLVREGKLTPVATGEGAAKRSITYHDPCYVGRHNQVYEPPRELLEVLPGADFVEMPRNKERSFCCGAGGARMWMEETIGSRINVARTQEAVATGADQIAVGCPFCRVMLSDGLTAEQADGNAREEVEVLDVAQMLLASVKGVPATRARAGTAAPAAPAESAPVPAESAAVPAETAAVSGSTAAVAETSTADLGAGGSLFDVAPATPAADEAPAPTADLGSGGSLFDVTPAEQAPTQAKPAADLGSSGSLFDVIPTVEESPPPAAEQDAPTPVVEEVVEDDRLETTPATTIPDGGSLFDIAAPAAPAAAAPAPTTEVSPAPVAAEAAKTETSSSPAGITPATTIPEGGSLFDIEAPTTPTVEDAPAPTVEDAPVAVTEEPSDQPGDPETILNADDSNQAAAPATLAAPAAPAAPGTYTPVTVIPEGASLFDIEAPAAPAEVPSAAPAPSAAAAAAAEEARASVTEEASATGEAQIQGDAPGDQPGDPDTLLDADDSAPATAPAGAAEAEPGAAAEDEPTAPPASSGPGHAPRTDADISGAGSLFDL